MQNCGVHAETVALNLFYVTPAAAQQQLVNNLHPPCRRLAPEHSMPQSLHLLGAQMQKANARCQ